MGKIGEEEARTVAKPRASSRPGHSVLCDAASDEAATTPGPPALPLLQVEAGHPSLAAGRGHLPVDVAVVNQHPDLRRHSQVQRAQVDRLAADPGVRGPVVQPADVCQRRHGGG